MGRSRRRKKKFACGCVGFGTFCHRCHAEKGEKVQTTSGASNADS